MTVLLWLWLALVSIPAAPAAPYLYLQPEDDTPDGPWHIVDSTGDRVYAWHFAHFTRDRETVNRLRFRMYLRRTTAISSFAVGGIVFLSASVAIPNRRLQTDADGGIDGAIVAYGLLAATGLTLAVVPPINFITRRPRWLQVDTHYTREEAIQRMQAQRGVTLYLAPNGFTATF
jgi:hypothetical protein